MNGSIRIMSTDEKNVYLEDTLTKEVMILADELFFDPINYNLNPEALGGDEFW